MLLRTRLHLLLLAASLIAAGCSARETPPMLIQTVAETVAPVSCDISAVQEVVERFGEQMKNVSVLASDSAAAQSIRQHYGPFVAPELLASWASFPSRAPGRMVSSPWPDRIDVLSVPAADGQECQVDGEVVYASTFEVDDQSPAWREPIIARVRQVGGRWQISGFRHGAQPRNGMDSAAPPEANEAPASTADVLLADTVSPSLPNEAEPPVQETATAPAPEVTPAASPAVPTVSRPTEAEFSDAAEVIRRYYEAIDARNYRRAYTQWADDGAASRKTYEVFSGGFSETAHVQAELGEVSWKDADARVAAVPVVIRAVTHTGEKQEFRGTYFVRWSVEGTGAGEPVRWHIGSARIRVAR